MTLKIKVFDNFGQFDEIAVTQIEKLEGDLRKYKISEPQGSWPMILHHRGDGWRPLVKKVLDILGAS